MKTNIIFLLAFMSSLSTYLMSQCISSSELKKSVLNAVEGLKDAEFEKFSKDFPSEENQAKIYANYLENLDKAEFYDLLDSSELVENYKKFWKTDNIVWDLVEAEFITYNTCNESQKGSKMGEWDLYFHYRGNDFYQMSGFYFTVGEESFIKVHNIDKLGLSWYKKQKQKYKNNDITATRYIDI